MSAKIYTMEEKSDSKGAFAEPLLAKPEDLSDTESRGLNGSQMMEMQTAEPSTKCLKDLDNTCEDLVCINLSGKKFFVMKKNFARFPNSRLSCMLRCSRREDIEKFCDLYQEGNIPEYFFDRSWKGFNDILDVYRLGRLHISTAGACAIRVKSQMTFWDIDELLLDPCCALKYYPEIDICEKEILGQSSSEQKYLERLQEEDFGSSRLGRLRKCLWNLTEYPETSLAARVCAFVSISVVIISTVTFVLSTMPELADQIDLILFENETNSQPPERWESGIIALRVVDQLTMWFFTIEYMVRFLCSPKKWKFFKAPLNVVDLLAILPYFVGFIVESVKDTLVIGRAGKVLRLIRVMRILRVFKLVRHFAGLQSLLSTLQQAYKELGLLMVLVSVTVLTVSSLVYFAEKDAEEKWTFLDSFWWGLMVLTTVGYGATAPSTPVGKSIGGFCALLGVFILALPVPIVVNRFTDFTKNHKNRVWRNEVMMLKQERKEEQDQMAGASSLKSRENGLNVKI